MAPKLLQIVVDSERGYARHVAFLLFRCKLYLDRRYIT